MQDNSPKDLQIKEWLKRANDDELSATVILREKGAPNTACFLSQQMAEKYLKVFLIASKKWYPKIHALDKLWELCQGMERSFDAIKDECIFLTDFYTETRYPGYVAFTLDEAEKAFDYAQRVKTFVLEKIEN